MFYNNMTYSGTLSGSVWSMTVTPNETGVYLVDILYVNNGDSVYLQYGGKTARYYAETKQRIKLNAGTPLTIGKTGADNNPNITITRLA